MRRRQVLTLLSVLAVYPAAALAQSKSIPKIGIVGSLNQRAIDELEMSRSLLNYVGSTLPDECYVALVTWQWLDRHAIVAA